MSILQALAARYERMAAEGEAPEPGFGPAQIAFTLKLDAGGQVVGVDDERRLEGKKLRPRIEPRAPLPPKRTVAIDSGTFWDKTSYVLGRTAPDPAATPARQARDAERTRQEHAAFIARHEVLLAETDDPGCLALLRFLRGWQPERYDALDHAADMLDQNVAFRLDGDIGFIHDRPAARAAVARAAATDPDAPTAMCLVTGATAPIARLHPSIKGVPGAQSSGASLVSFNLDAFNSYGNTQGGNAPVSEHAAFAYATALNALLSPSGTNAKGWVEYRNRVRLGNVTVVFWADTSEAERIAGGLFDSQPADEATETDAVKTILQQMEQGKPLRDAAPKVDPATRVYVLGLSANAARLSVRFWMQQSIGDLAARFTEHWNDLRLDPPPRLWPPSIRALLLELAAQGDAENVPDHLNGEFMRAILTGLPYPRSLLAQAVMRLRSDQDAQDRATGRTREKVSELRICLLKACLARAHRKGLFTEDVPVSHDPANKEAAYRLGRLFSVLERLQRAALGQRNATIRDRFYASASATPAIVFPSLIRNARNHSKKVRSATGAGLAEWFEDRVAEVVAGLTVFPKTLTLEQQGLFALGYYHQRAAFLHKKDVPAEIDAADAVADTSEED
ncbi:MAG: type I-C CRISPR-associated protein Cas8c/Csd1 [Proteobacteria bacterium]|nr:type I-C CRISPR-associated protein Cas8c/Csd1 [Pseudomonadota bacterium]